MGPYASLCVFMGPNGFLQVLIRPYGSKGSFWVLIGIYASSWIRVGPNGFL